MATVRYSSGKDLREAFDAVNRGTSSSLGEFVIAAAKYMQATGSSIADVAKDLQGCKNGLINVSDVQYFTVAAALLNLPAKVRNEPAVAFSPKYREAEGVKVYAKMVQDFRKPRFVLTFAGRLQKQYGADGWAQHIEDLVTLGFPMVEWQAADLTFPSNFTKADREAGVKAKKKDGKGDGNGNKPQASDNLTLDELLIIVDKWLAANPDKRRSSQPDVLVSVLTTLEEVKVYQD